MPVLYGLPLRRPGAPDRRDCLVQAWTAPLTSARPGPGGAYDPGRTAEPLRACAGRPEADTAAEVEAFHLVQRFRIGRQLATQDREGINRVNPSELNELHRLMLKESFRQAKKLQLRLRQEQGL